MKTNILSKKSFIIASALIFSCILIFVIWQYVLPGYVATEVLGKFEDACYAGNADKIMGLIHSQAPYYDMCKKDINGLQKVFSKFEKGFRIIKTHRGFGSLPPDGSHRKEIILVSLSKIAKIDGRERSLSSELAKIDGEWKIMYYYFQDLIDY